MTTRLLVALIRLLTRYHAWRRRVRLWLSVPSLSRGAKARILREVLARRGNYFQDDWRDE